MIVEFTVHESFDILSHLADDLKVAVVENKLVLPTWLGNGYVKKIDLGREFKFVLHQYTLAEDFLLKRLPSSEENRMLSIVFNSLEIPSAPSPDQQEAIAFLQSNSSAIQISSSSFGTQSFFPSGSKVYFAVIGIDSAFLKSILQIEKCNDLLKTILEFRQPFFYHERMTSDILHLIQLLAEADERNELLHFFYKLKIQELLYLLFGKLLRRSANAYGSITNDELAKLYEIRLSIISDFGKPPRLSELARSFGMSETKMKRLFRQIFGDSIYNYFQTARMEQAAILLKQTSLSVSEIGFELGFINLSHFSRLFERFYGMTPKKYISAG